MVGGAGAGGGEIEQLSWDLQLTRVHFESKLSLIYNALTAGKGVAYDYNILQSSLLTHCLQVGVATTTTPSVTSAFAKDIDALIFAVVSISVYSQRAFTL